MSYSRLSFIEKNQDVLKNKRKIFISYRKKDEIDFPKIKMLINLILDEVDCGIWYDSNLKVGQDYNQEIQDAISECDVIVVLLTPNILDSDYIWDKEISSAKKQHKGVIPVVAGLSETKFSKIEEKIGSIQNIIWFTDEANPSIEFSLDFKEKLKSGIELFLLNVSIIDRVISFVNSRKFGLSKRYLSFEELYLISYGYLNKIIQGENDNEGIQLLKTIITIPGDDQKLIELKLDSINELIRYSYFHGEIKLFVESTKALLHYTDRFIPTNSLLFQSLSESWNSDSLNNEGINWEILNHYKNCISKTISDEVRSKIIKTNHNRVFTSIKLKKAPRFSKFAVHQKFAVNNHNFCMIITPSKVINGSKMLYILKDNYILCEFKIADYRSLAATNYDSVYMAYNKSKNELHVIKAEMENYGGLCTWFYEIIINTDTNMIMNKDLGWIEDKAVFLPIR